MTPADAPPPGIALWRRLADTLAVEIAAGTPGPGQRLPAEAALAARFGVNRHTLRRAIEALVQQGLVRVVRGSGSFVADEVMDYIIGERPRFSTWIRAHAREPSGRAVELGLVAATPAQAAALGLTPGDPVVRLLRLGLADGRPVSLAAHEFSVARFPGLLAEIPRHPSLTAALAACGLADYRRRETRISARLPTRQEAALLRIPRARPVIATTTLNTDPAGAVVEYGEAVYPTPRVELVFPNEAA